MKPRVHDIPLLKSKFSMLENSQLLGAEKAIDMY